MTSQYLCFVISGVVTERIVKVFLWGENGIINNQSKYKSKKKKQQRTD